MCRKNGNLDLCQGVTYIKRPRPNFGHPKEISPIVVELLSGHQALNTLSLVLFQEYDEGK